MATVISTVGLAFIGYLATYLNGLRLAQRQARLTRVNPQLSDLYGPLFAQASLLGHTAGPGRRRGLLSRR